MSAPWGGRGLAAKRTKVDRGREGVQLKVDIFFSVVSVGERRAFKSHFIIIFLCKDGKIKMLSRNEYSRHVFFKQLLFFNSFCSCLFLVQLSVRTDRGRGLLSQKWTGVSRGREGD